MDYLHRATRTIRVFAKHGLASLIVKHGLAHYLPFFKRRSKKHIENVPAKMRKAMEELGGAWIKLGQMLSLRPDLIPPRYANEFSKLLDQVPPGSIEDVRKVIESSFGKPVKSIFKHLDPRPLGSASVAQVHKARLVNGKPVAVKVLRPEVKQQFKSDIAIMMIIARQLEDRIDSIAKPKMIVDEFENYTKKELNLTAEASHIDTIRKNNKIPSVIIPKVYWDYTNDEVLTMDYLEGEKISKLEKKEMPAIAKKLTKAIIDQIYEHGFFHADLHPGNVLKMENGRIGLLDFGITGHIDAKTKELSLEMYRAIIEQKNEEVAELLLKYGGQTKELDKNKFVQEVTDLIYQWWELRPSERRITRLMHQLFVTSANKGVGFPRDSILLGKALMTAEATARKLNPDFEFVKYTKEHMLKLLEKKSLPRRRLKTFAEQSKQFAESVMNLPKKTAKLLDTVQKGRLSVALEDEHFRHIGKDLNFSSNRLSFALIASALIVAAALIVDIGPTVYGYGAFSILSLTFAAFFTIALFVSISREHKSKYDRHKF